MIVDWGPVMVAVARVRVIEFGNMYTSGISILIHAILYFCIYTLVVVAIGGVESEEDEGVEHDSFAVGFGATKLNLFGVSGELKEKPRLQKYEEYNSHKHRPPVRHSCTFTFIYAKNEMVEEKGSRIVDE
ncbi:hypothetical protein SASPL_135094 [Salvia splendens]|uniref:Transmembrane protein n=1 Tax=Salvia splendens TaxID=180675 RepID=A0A8X8WXI5_SALSN|nr:hypothetical protein SASPL_135094 [Salvia splendens]